MIGYTSEKVQKEWTKAPVALRLVAEALQKAWGGPMFVFRVDSPTKFEKGVHAAGLAMDVDLRGASEAELLAACRDVNNVFFPKGPGVQVATVKTNRANFPSGARIDRPHVHIQIPFDWKADPRAFLREHGFTGGSPAS